MDAARRRCSAVILLLAAVAFGLPSGPAQSPPSARALSLPSAQVSTYRDDFSDPASGWPQQASDPTRRQMGYADGEYSVVRLAGAGEAAGAARDLGPIRVADVGIDARLVPPIEN